MWDKQYEIGDTHFVLHLSRRAAPHRSTLKSNDGTEGCLRTFFFFFCNYYLYFSGIAVSLGKSKPLCEITFADLSERYFNNASKWKKRLKEGGLLRQPTGLPFWIDLGQIFTILSTEFPGKRGSVAAEAGGRLASLRVQGDPTSCA